MKIPHHLDDEVLGTLLLQQKRLAFDKEKDLPWSQGVDLTKPFVPLDFENRLFPQITTDEKLALSQYMGLMIAATFSEMEMTMQRLCQQSWRPLMEKKSPNPEMIDLGEEFFLEEAKHADIFQRYLDMTSQALGLDPEDLKNILPRVNPGYVDRVIRNNSQLSGLLLWWIVATVEEESTLIFRQMKRAEGLLDPLYYTLHQKHFEEEARHAPYPFLMLELNDTVASGLMTRLMQKTDFVVSQVLKIIWMIFELSKTVSILKFKNHHPFFFNLSTLLPKLGQNSLMTILSEFAFHTPYISTFINPLSHPYTRAEVIKRGALALPLPQPVLGQLGWHH